jgi:hypothetical protein
MSYRSDLDRRTTELLKETAMPYDLETRARDLRGKIGMLFDLPSEVFYKPTMPAVSKKPFEVDDILAKVTYEGKGRVYTEADIEEWRGYAEKLGMEVFLKDPATICVKTKEGEIIEETPDYVRAQTILSLPPTSKIFKGSPYNLLVILAENSLTRNGEIVYNGKIYRTVPGQNPVFAAEFYKIIKDQLDVGSDEDIR